MKKIDFERMLTLVDDAYIEDALKESKLQKSNRKKWLKWAVCAACIGGIAWGYFIFLGGKGTINYSEKSDIVKGDINKIDDEAHYRKETLDLPVITIVDTGSAMGQGGYVYYSADELDNGNPWKEEAELGTLPVFKNQAVRDGAGILTGGYSEEELKKMAEETAEALNLKVISMEIKEVNGGGNMLIAELEKGDIRAFADGEIQIFMEGETFPWDSQLLGATKASDIENAKKIILREAETYKAFTGFLNPQPVVSDYGYSFLGERSDNVFWAYDGAGSLTEQIISYQFDRVYFRRDGIGDDVWVEKGYVISTIQYDLSEKIGDYPLITLEEAKSQIVRYSGGEEGSDYPGDEYVVKVDLIYNKEFTGLQTEYFIPYYRFYVERPDDGSIEMAEGLTLYETYYVPAISEKYLDITK